MAVRARGGDPQRDAVVLGGHGAFEAAFAAVHRGGPGAVPAARCFGDAPIHRDIAQLQADHAVIGAQRQGMHLMADPRRGPRLEPTADCAV